ncbi:MAG: SMI1/KNR4 family protein [Proteobacteria bacterium]|nr:SMI1/KNR4 family protein [Pseudomonadota bacterium]
MIIEGALDQINENDLIELENQINIKIPEQYRNFLLSNNGGKPKINRFSTQDKKVESMIAKFLPLANIEEDNLLEEIEGITQADLIPQNLIPIATDPADNRLVLSVAGSDMGKIYYWSWDEEPRRKYRPSYKYMRLVADSFDDLLALLH